MRTGFCRRRAVGIGRVQVGWVVRVVIKGGRFIGVAVPDGRLLNLREDTWPSQRGVGCAGQPEFCIRIVNPWNSGKTVPKEGLNRSLLTVGVQITQKQCSRSRPGLFQPFTQLRPLPACRIAAWPSCWSASGLAAGQSSRLTS
ncbi:MAG: hypothetical protein R3C44_09525 [Chloroflexota bacterium]